MKIFSLAIALFFSAFLFSNIHAGSKQLINYDRAEITLTKEQLKSNTASSATMKAYNDLLTEANKYLAYTVSPVTEKQLMPPTNSKNDYLSISRYWWPDPSKPDGLPWIRKDGDTNPDTQNDSVDRKRLGKMTSAVKVLGLAYFFSDNEVYAKKGTSILRTWFMHPKTRMNPHLKYAQTVPGINKSRRSGILDGRGIPGMVLDPVLFFSTSKSWKEKDSLAMDQWLRDYMVWLVYSEVGIDGSKQKNNHGLWYFYQVTAIAWYNKDLNLIKETLEKVKGLFASQLDENGGQHEELKRTRSYFYSCFSLDAYTRIAAIAEKAEMPIWNATLKDEKSLEKAIDFLMPATKDPSVWTYKTKKGPDTYYMAIVLERIKDKIKNDSYKTTLNTIITTMSTKKQKGQRNRFLRNHQLLYRTL